MYEALDELSLKELIGYSIRSEKKANKFYNQIADELPELMSNRFKSLADDEEMHKRHLLKLHKKLFGDTDYVVPEKEGLPPHEGDVKLDSVSNLLESLDKAMDNERNAYRIYKYLAENHEEHQNLFEYLAIMEHGHLESLKKEKEMLEGRVTSRPDARNQAPDSFFSFEFEKRQTQ